MRSIVRCAALRRRTGTHSSLNQMYPGSAAHHGASHSASKTRVNALMALRSIRGTPLDRYAACADFLNSAAAIFKSSTKRSYSRALASASGSRNR
jgi:hypothetical protein